MSRRSIIGLVALAVLGLIGVGAAAVLVSDGDRRLAAISQLESSPGYWALQVDGQIVGRLASVETCGPYGELLQSLSATSHGETQQDQRITRVRFRNCVVKFGVGMGLPLFNWIDMTLDRQPQKKNVVLLGFTGDGSHPQVGLRLMNSLIKKVVFPEVEAETVAPYLITLTIQPETVVREEPPQIAGPGPTGTGVVGLTFDNLRLNNQNVANVNKIGPVVVTQETTDQQVVTQTGEVRIISSLMGITYEPVKVEVVRSPNHPLATWFESFVVEGQRSNNAEKDAELQIRDDDFNSPIRFSFEGVGIFDSSDSADLIWRRYSLYFEDLSMLFVPIATPAPPPQPQPQSATGTTTNQTTTNQTTTNQTTTNQTTTEPDEETLAAPTGVSVIDVAAGRVELRWEAVEGAEGYLVLSAAAPGGDYAQVSKASDNSAVVEKLEGDPPYYFVVRAYRGDAESENSAEVEAKG